MAELTVEEARTIYKKSDALKALMLTKFSKSELEGVTQEEFDKTFLELLGQCTKKRFLDEKGNESRLPTNRIELRNSNNEWLFDLQFTGKNKRFWVSYYRVWKIFKDTDSLEDEDIKRLMKNQMNIQFGLNDVTPNSGLKPDFPMMNIQFGLNDVTPNGCRSTILNWGND
jgi:hypothetical protein